jgi:hypothetical protein
MSAENNIPEIDDGINRQQSAVSIYGQADAMDDFPVLKAFQQYIDAEQNKARKRMIMLCVFFGFLMAVVVAVFVAMLQSVNLRNQTLNDRLVEYAMKDRDRTASPVVVQSAPAQDNSVLIALSSRVEALQKQLLEKSDSEKKVKIEPPSPTVSAADLEREKKIQAQKDALERARLKLKIEQDKLAEEKERLRKEEVERNRRRIYADYYERQERLKNKVRSEQESIYGPEDDIDDAELNLDDEDAIEYFKPRRKSPSSAGKSLRRKKLSLEQQTVSEDSAINYFDIPVEVKSTKESSGSSPSWHIPEE